MVITDQIESVGKAVASALTLGSSGNIEARGGSGNRVDFVYGEEPHRYRLTITDADAPEPLVLGAVEQAILAAALAEELDRVGDSLEELPLSDADVPALAKRERVLGAIARRLALLEVPL